MKKTEKNSVLTKDEIESKQCDERHLKSIEVRKQWAGNSSIKKWFFLGRKECYKDYGSTLYDKLKWKAFKHWQKKTERHGVNIKRDYFYKENNAIFGINNYRIYNSNSWEILWKCLSIKWWKEVFEKLVGQLAYKYKVCTFDFYDVEGYLITALTIKGLYFGLHGNAVSHKDQMQKCWEIRKEIIKSASYDDIYQSNKDNIFKKKFNIPYDITTFSEEEYLKNGTVVGWEQGHFHNCEIGENPKLIESITPQYAEETSIEYRKRIMKKYKELEKFHRQNSIYQYTKMAKDIHKKAYSLLGDNIENLWD